MFATRFFEHHVRHDPLEFPALNVGDRPLVVATSRDVLDVEIFGVGHGCDESQSTDVYVDSTFFEL